MRIAIFLPNYIGDILMTTPAIRLLRQNFPEAEISVVVKKDYYELLEKNPNINITIFKTSRWGILKEIIGFKPDTVLLFRTTFFNSLVTLLSKAKYTVGIDEDCGRIFLSAVVHKDLARSYRYECVEIVRTFFKQIDKSVQFLSEELKKIDFYGYDEEIVKVSLEEKLKKNNIEINKKFIVINPISTRKTKMLSYHQYLKLLKLVKEKFSNKYEIILVGGKKDENFINSLQKETGTKSLCGKLSFKELGCLLHNAKIFLSPDTGPAFISQAVGCKTIIYFTSTSPERYGPYNENVEIIYHPLICSPCYKDICREKEKYKCISQMNLEEIIDKITNFLI